MSSTDRIARIGLLLASAGCAQGEWTPSTPVTAESPEARLLAVLDDNGDGALDATEFGRHASGPADFAMADLDASGTVDAAELRSLLWELETGPRGMGGGKEEKKRHRERRRRRGGG